MTGFVDIPRDQPQLFIRRQPGEPWERVGGVDKIVTDDLDIMVHCRPSWWTHIDAARGYAAWNDDDLQESWRRFSSQRLLCSLFDVDDIAVMFHAIVALFRVVRLGEIAWERHSQ